MLRENTKRYWLDIVHKPVTFYALTDIRKRGDYSFIFGTTYERIYPPIPSVSLWEQLNNWVTDFWHLMWLQPLLQPEWRASVWLLAAIVALGSLRVVGPRRAT